jgi:hypothetical protein
MLKQNRVLITLITHKKEPGKYELLSLINALEIFKKYHFVLVISEKMSSDFYVSLFEEKNIKYKIEKFGKQFFGKISRYNNLLLSRAFYERFVEYDYILINHFDSFVFRDELEYWCDKGYSYIGAPWPEGKMLHPYSFRGFGLLSKLFPFMNKPKKFYVGNGGFCLKNVKDHIAILDKFCLAAKLWHSQEDYFWAYYCHKYKGSASVPSEIEASSFSLEKNSKYYYVQNHSKLPFGCHSFEKVDFEFWRDKISILQ